MRTFLPVYNRLILQDWYKSKAKKPVMTPRYRLPSMQWDAVGDVTEILLVNDSGDIDITSYFEDLPAAHSTGGVLIYNGDQLEEFLPTGMYYLQISTDEDEVFYSEWFKVCEIFENLITGWTNSGYETFTSSGTTISSAIETSGLGSAISSNSFAISKGETVTLLFNFTLNSGDAPYITLVTAIGGAQKSNEVVAVAGVQSIELTATEAMTAAFVRIENDVDGNWSTGEILVYREYSEDFLMIEFSSSCDIGDYFAPEGVVFLDADIGESFYEETEEAQENGNGDQVPTFRRQEKRYVIRAGLVPEYFVDALYLMKLCDTIEITDKKGIKTTMGGIDIQSEWAFEEKYFLLCDIVFNRGEVVIVTGCC